MFTFKRLETGMGELHLVMVGGSGDRAKSPISELLALRVGVGFLVYLLPDHNLVS